MIADQLQCRLNFAQELFRNGHHLPAMREAEFAVDEFWMTGDSKITSALPLLSMLGHANGVQGSVFDELHDLPKSLSDELSTEASLLHRLMPSKASAKMLDDLNRFMDGWGEEDSVLVDVPDREPADEPADEPENETTNEPTKEHDALSEKAVELIAQIEQLKTDGNKKLAVETALELANEYALRNENRKATKLFKQVLEKAKRYELTSLRIDGLLDFGQFFNRLGRFEDAERALRLAAGVARKAKDADRFAHVIAALGVVLAHAKNDAAEKYLTKASSLLSPWDVESDIVNHHLEAIREGGCCDCPEASISAFSEIDWK